MKVSLCMIVKDEEDVLRDCLESVKDLVDEIIIVDTGSTDGTLDIAREYADVLEEVPWNGFSEARNKSIELASGDVILILDADERIVKSVGWDVALEKLDEGADAAAFIVHNQLPPDQILLKDQLWQVRMFHNRKEIRYRGKVHNQVTDSLKNNPLNGEKAVFVQVDVHIEHLGYNKTEDERKAKYKDRVHLCLEEAEKAEDEAIRAYYLFQTSNAYFMLGDKSRSLEFARKCDLSKLTGENKYSLALMACHSCSVFELKEEALKWAKLMMDLMPEESMSFLMLGLSYMSLGNYKGAYNLLGAVLSQCQLRGMAYKYSLDGSYVSGAAGEAALALGRYGEAKALFNSYLENHTDERIADLERRIIPLDEAQKQGLVDEEGKVVDPQAGVVEDIEIPDRRKTG